MSIRVMTWVLDNSPAQLVNRLVLIVLADKANDDGGGAWPSARTIASQARCSVRSAQYALNALKEAGAITPTGKSEYGTTVWRVLMTAEAANANFAQRPTAERARKQRQEGAQTPTPDMSQFAPNPSGNSAVDPPMNPSSPPPPRGETPLPPPPEGNRARTQRAWEAQALDWLDANGFCPAPGASRSAAMRFLHDIKPWQLGTDLEAARELARRAYARSIVVTDPSPQE